MRHRLYASAPLSIKLGRKKYSLNLNTYRNMHYRVNNMCKQEFKELMKPQLLDMKNAIKLNIINEIKYPIHIEYELIVGSNRLTDIGNVCCVIEKYFEDALTFYGIIEDDNYKYISDVRFLFGGVDKDNPRCEIEIWWED